MQLPKELEMSAVNILTYELLLHGRAIEASNIPAHVGQGHNRVVVVDGK